MFWQSWPRADQLALLGVTVAILSLVATVTITLLVYRLSSKSSAVGQQALQKMSTLQDQLHGVAQRTRRDELVDRLKIETNGQMLRVMRTEVDTTYTGEDRAILQSVYRANALTPLPYRGSISETEFEDFLPSIAVRLQKMPDQRAGIIQFASAVGHSDLEGQWKLASALYEGSTPGSILPHTFFRKAIAADWHLAPQLVDVVTSRFDWEYPARSTNLLTGVFVGLIDIDPRSGGSRGERTLQSRAEDTQLQAEMLQSLAGLLHYGPLTGLGRLDRERPMYEQGSTEPLTALVAWLIRAAGNAVAQDGHLEMRVMESLADVVLSVKNSQDWRGHGVSGGWGIDDEDVQVGMLRMRKKCPGLWSNYGDELISATNISLEPLITRKRQARAPTVRSVFDPPETQWSEVYDDVS